MKTSLVFLHGGPGYQDYLEGFFAGQFEKKFETRFYTQDQSPSVTVDRLLEELDGVLAASAGRSILIGHSWGGILAAEYARRIGDARLAGIALIDSCLCSDDITVEYKKELERRGLEKPSLEQLFFTARERPAAGPLIARLERTLNEAAFQNLWTEFASNFEHRDWAGTTNLPILNVFGDDDVRIPTARIRRYAALSPRIENVEIAGAGHFPFVLPEDRAQVVRAIERFAARVV